MSCPRVGDLIELEAWFEDSAGAGLGGLTVLAYLQDESGNLTLNGVSMSASSVTGLYRYVGAVTYDVAGWWSGKAVASGGSPAKTQAPFRFKVEGAYTAARAANLDNLNATVLSRSSHSAADVAALVPTAGENADAIWDETLTRSNHNTATSAGRRLRVLGDTIGANVVDAAPTTTSFVTDLPSSVTGFYNDQTLRFTNGPLDGQVRAILAYDGATKRVTLDEALTSAPANGNDFDVLPYHIHPVSQIGTAVWAAGTRTLTSLSGLITSGASIVQPVAVGGAVTIYQGDDYQDARALVWTDTSFGNLSTATITVTVLALLAGEEDWSVSTAVGGPNTITLELTAAQTQAMQPTNLERMNVARKLLISATESGGLRRTVLESTWSVRQGA